MSEKEKAVEKNKRETNKNSVNSKTAKNRNNNYSKKTNSNLNKNNNEVKKSASNKSNTNMKASTNKASTNAKNVGPKNSATINKKANSKAENKKTTQAKSNISAKPKYEKNANVKVDDKVVSKNNKPAVKKVENQKNETKRKPYNSNKDISKKVNTSKKVDDLDKENKHKNIFKLDFKNDKKAEKTEKEDNVKVSKKEESLSVKKENELVELNKKKKVKEETIIQKIKNFLAKIAEMQEEAKKEITEIKENAKVKKEKTESNKNKEEKTTLQTNYLLEYYDLPYRYNETVVKILAQTPRKLFVYWDISDEDKAKFIKSFGENFFVDTYPVLLLFNEEKQYIKEVVINDFANSWYIDIDDPKTKYSIQLGRKFKTKPEIINMEVFQENNIILQTDYLPIAMSNKIEAPNDHILFENFKSEIKFRNVKTNQETTRNIKTFDKKIAKAYDLESFYDIYKELYKDGIENGMFDLNNPTSGSTSSSFK